VLLLILCAACVTARATNALAGHPSPYLAMHGQDPVDWQTWQAQPVAQARREDKLLYLSVGYFSCHWCHVMHRESYLDPGVARLLNAHFVPIKIDRELQPALDHHLMEFMQATRGHGGWPLNVFLTPEGYPLYATTYLPAERFRSLLTRLDERWREDREKLGRYAKEAAASIQSRRPKLDETRLDPSTARDYALAYVRTTAALADLENGGFGTRAKFPTTPQLQQLLRIASAAWPGAACATIWAAASFATAPTPSGGCRTSRRCSTTMRCLPIFTWTLPSYSTRPAIARWQSKRSSSYCVSCGRTVHSLPASRRWTTETSRAATTCGRTPPWSAF
jgi:thioredoxin-related protein